MVSKGPSLVNKIKTKMPKKNKRAKSVDDEFRFCEGLEGN
jgi:hypothetical protein